jgi:prophage maintenance system killer protein
VKCKYFFAAFQFHLFFLVEVRVALAFMVVFLVFKGYALVIALLPVVNLVEIVLLLVTVYFLVFWFSFFLVSRLLMTEELP